jgi:hypothetical protein
VLTITRKGADRGKPWTESISVRHLDGKERTVHVGSNLSFADLCKKVGSELLGVQGSASTWRQTA